MESPNIQERNRRSSAKRPPLVPGVPILGNAARLTKDPLRFFLDQYHKYGPIFRIRILNREYTILAGLNANRFFAREGDSHFQTDEIYADLGRELESVDFLAALDGPRHRMYRKIMRQGFSRERFLTRAPEMVESAEHYLKPLKPGESVPALRFFQRVITDQLGLLLTGMQPGEYFEDLLTFFEGSMGVHVLKMYPKLALQLPKFRRAKRRSLEFGEKVLAAHAAAGPDHKPTMLDDLKAARDDDGKELARGVLMTAAVGSPFAGLDTAAGTCAFMAYAVHSVPGVRERAAAEADRLFEQGIGDVNTLKRTEILHSVVMETLRLYPVAPMVPRAVKESFEFEGYTVEKGSMAMVVTGLTHLLPECFPNPDVFDIDRYANGWKPAPNSFGAFAFGAHSCLGAGAAEVQIMVNLAAMLHTTEFEPVAPDHQLKIDATPIPHPGDNFALRVAKQRS